MDKEKRTQRIEQKVVRIKEELGKIGPMRPGPLPRQYRDTENGTGAYWQISYTRHMKGRSGHVRRVTVHGFFVKVFWRGTGPMSDNGEHGWT